ncbi:CTP synthase [Candidatus Saccharibacteria bacterium]|nr:CTP synthase [Candidatus Saccharibacteria bacterium]MCB9821361.1 CTP synthase [Candidatus Nomurabacteria bacterium]
MRSSQKYIIVTGGVISGNGKGITSASIGACLKARGVKVNMLKFDMYLNVDAGTLKPGKHGEVFVTKDGAETDLDLGHYERFLDTEMTHKSSIMQGRILKEIIDKERSGGFKGDDVQVLPHVTNAIQDKILEAAEGFDVQMVELGGTVGDYEGMAFVEAVRQFAHRVGRENIIYVHVVYLPYLEVSNEIKTKPAQNAARDLRSIGINPDFLVARCEHAPQSNTIFKLSLFTDIPEERIVVLQNASTVYEVPLTLEKRGMASEIARKLGVKHQPDLSAWKTVVSSAKKQYSKTVKIGMVAKYLDNLDTYMSVTEALKAAAWSEKVNLEVIWVNAEEIEKLNQRELALELMKYHGILVPGGFGERGIEGMIATANQAIHAKIPYFGICLGLQVATIAFARNQGLVRANSKEFNPKGDQLVISTMPGQEGKEMTGGTMRLGNYPCDLTKGSLAEQLYGKPKIVERHRHRFEFNPEYKDMLVAAGLKITGICPENGLAEIIELGDHPYFIGCQYHPEFLSRPTRPHPLFSGLIRAAKKRT